MHWHGDGDKARVAGDIGGEIDRQVDDVRLQSAFCSIASGHARLSGWVPTRTRKQQNIARSKFPRRTRLPERRRPRLLPTSRLYLFSLTRWLTASMSSAAELEVAINSAKRTRSGWRGFSFASSNAWYPQRVRRRVRRGGALALGAQRQHLAVLRRGNLLHRDFDFDMDAEIIGVGELGRRCLHQFAQRDAMPLCTWRSPPPWPRRTSHYRW